MALVVSLTDPKNGTPYPRAYARVEEAHLTLSADYVDATIALFYSVETANAGLDPVYVYPTFTLTTEEVSAPNPAFVQALAALVQQGKIRSPKDALTACLYVLLKARSDFTKAVDG